VAERASVGAVWLLGEAAHQLSPMASHSLNHGVRMAHDLAATIDEVARDQGAGERLAHQAARARAQTLRLAEVGELFHAEPDTDPFIAANLRRILPMLPVAGLELEAMAGALRLAPRPL
jgi:2-polyprenyl-6-methoxyphenol hydroxylase-like FAD-dependent oxidoreductase